MSHLEAAARLTAEIIALTLLGIAAGGAAAIVVHAVANRLTCKQTGQVVWAVLKRWTETLRGGRGDRR